VEKMDAMARSRLKHRFGVRITLVDGSQGVQRESGCILDGLQTARKNVGDQMPNH